MKIMFITDTVDCWRHGIWWHRIQTPTEALKMRGHAVKQVAMGSEFPENLLDWPDVVVFGRTYPMHYNPVKVMRDFRKRGARLVYDMDDDFWNVAEDNPSALVSNAMKDQYEGMIAEADICVTPSDELAKKFKKVFKKKAMICPNGISTDVYKERPRTQEKVVVGYMGAASHWKDLQIVAEAISDLQQKHDFLFTIYGITGEPLEAAFYAYKKYLDSNLQPEKNKYFQEALAFQDQLKNLNMWHIPFMPPELHPSILSRCDFDIGIAPLEDTVFNRGKSCIKFYEYASVGTVTLASDVLPYKKEVNYLAKNNKKDWMKKLEKLIVDEEFRQKTLEKQQKFVFENRTLEAIGLPWELALQKPGGAKVLNQQK